MLVPQVFLINKIGLSQIILHVGHFFLLREIASSIYHFQRIYHFVSTFERNKNNALRKDLLLRKRLKCNILQLSSCYQFGNTNVQVLLSLQDYQLQYLLIFRSLKQRMHRIELRNWHQPFSI